jgi:hypothetical protein
MAWDLLFTSDYGLFSVFVIVFVIGMAIWFPYFFKQENARGREQARR